MAEVTDPTETSQLLGNSSSAQPDYNTTAIDPSQADNERNDSGFSEDPCIGPLSNIKKYRRTKTLSNRLSTSAQQRSFRDQSYSYKQSWLQSLKRQSRLLSVDASSRISKPSREPLVIFKDLLDLLLFHNVPGPMLFRLREEFNTLLGYGRTFQTFGVSEPRILNALTQVGNVLNRRRDKPQADERPLEGLEKKLKSLQAVAVKRSYADSPVYGNIDAAFSAESSTRAFGQQLYFVEREIENLCHPRIRGHPNIVRLLGWGLCLDTLEDPRADSPRIPLLIVERAHSSLTAFIKDYPIRGDTITTYEIYRKICLDVGRGIEAIHDLGLIHGDVKLDNILLFSKDGKRTAKLSDFGLTSAAGPEPGTRDTPEYKGTPRWTPPPGSACYQLDQLYQFDLFAYGLVVWCAFTGRTRSPMPPDEAINGGPFSPDELYDTAIQSLANSKWNSDDEMSQNIFDWCSESDQNRLKKVLRCCLHNDSRFWRRRPWKFFDKKKYPTVGPVIGNATLLIDLSQYFRRGKAQCMRRVATAEDKCGAVVNNVWKPVKHFASNISAQVLKHPIAIVRTLLSSLFADRSLVIRAPRSSTRRKQIEEISRQFRDSLNLSLDATSIAFLVHGIDAPCLSYKLLLQELETAISRLPPPKQAERLSIPRGEIQRLNDHTYALARICSRIPLCCFKHSAYDGNLVAQALQRDCNFSTLVWLCRGDVGNFQVSNLDVRTLTYWLSLVRPPQRTRTRSSDTLSRFILLCERGCRINRRVAGQQKSVLRVMLEVLGPRSQEGEYFLQFLVQLQKYAAGPESAASMPHPLRYFLTGQGIPDHLGEPPMEETAEYWTTALHECVKIPYYAAVEALVFAGFEVNSLDGQARTASQYAYELQPISRDDQRRKAILLEKDRILGLLRQHPTKVWEPGSLGDRSSQTTLPLGWDVHHIEGIYNDLVPFPEDIEVFQDRHFGSVTLKKPRFSFFSDQRLALGFRKVNIPGQTYYMDLLRFIIRQSTLPDPAMPIEWIFLDTWYEEEAARNDAVHVIRVYNRPMADGQNNRPIIVAYRRFTSSVSRRLHWMFPKFMGFIVSIPQVLNKFFGIGAGILTAIIRIPFVLFKGLFAMLIRSCLSRAFNILSVFVPLSCVAYARNWHYEYKIIFSLLALMYISDMIRIALAYLQGPQTDKFHGQDLFSTMCSVHLEVFIGALLIQRNVPQLFFPLLIGSLLWNMQFVSLYQLFMNYILTMHAAIVLQTDQLL
ncbi:hypothetical protein K469DRAFT_206577 [Zopfia rhizophila CBS 207.26]|uniref:Protein kinase domain-containing protein n=1 Tax=Zopfia rhizophila CBS 207.26 TaxID=1314779 RepID=A0A6A6E1C6_9PEZI|nr:hypothetical protein K469DRAFT_206577 [Zopfia rhizophila CBS 207.26]